MAYKRWTPYGSDAEATGTREAGILAYVRVARRCGADPWHYGWCEHRHGV